MLTVWNIKLTGIADGSYFVDGKLKMIRIPSAGVDGKGKGPVESLDWVITKGKSIEYWGMDEPLFRQTMAAFGIPESGNLQQLDKLSFKIETRKAQPSTIQSADLIEHIIEVSRCISLE